MSSVLPKENYTYLLIGFIIIIIGFALMIGGRSDDPNVFNENEFCQWRLCVRAPFSAPAAWFFPNPILLEPINSRKRGSTVPGQSDPKATESASVESLRLVRVSIH